LQALPACARIRLARTVIFEELGRSIALPPRNRGAMGPGPILLRLTEPQRERFLYPALRGEKFACFAQTEPGAGGDPAAMETTAVLDGDVYVVNGTKRFIGFVDETDFVQLFASTDRSKGARGVTAFGAPLAQRQSIQWMLVDMYLTLKQLRLMTYQTALRYDRGEDVRHDSYMCKYFGDESSFTAADRCMQIHGGIGLTTDFPIETFWRDQRSFTITEGPTEILKMTPMFAPWMSSCSVTNFVRRRACSWPSSSGAPNRTASR
jgi:alkylation response protein AidB-like acyl-CoA dehydrogenase